jgi:hypothetical protein
MKSPSPALRERVASVASRVRVSAAGKTLTRPRAIARGHPLPQCGRGSYAV